MVPVRDIAEAGVNAMQAEANQLMQHQTVRLAYDQFMMVCKLTQSQPDNK